MRARLGIDTGGTYTDAVLMDEAGHILASAKSETSRHDLSLGIGQAINGVMNGRQVEIELVGLSTTLATNAIVEGRGGRAGLLMIGFQSEAATRSGLERAIARDAVRRIEGGHDAHGKERKALEHGPLRRAIGELAAQADAIAITSAFAVRNPTHELEAARMVEEICGLPVTMSHQLTARLDGPRRALTTVLNAQLVPEISRLLEAVTKQLAVLGIKAPVMVVRGDGSLMKAGTARTRPVETILSGPAASVVGAAKLAKLEQALISDVGGTTTDIALLDAGRPRLDPEGAQVGGFRTMVEAIAVRTSGLGGDSRIRPEGIDKWKLGPERSVPLSLLAKNYDCILESLQKQLERGQPRPLDGQFAVLARRPDDTLNKSQQALVDLLSDAPRTLEQVIERAHLGLPLERLEARGIVAHSGFTPSDAAHCLGQQETWERRASELGAQLELRKRRQTAGWSTKAFAKHILGEARVQTVLALAEAASAADGAGFGSLTGHPAIRRASLADDGPKPVLRLQFELDRPVVAVGGPAHLFYSEAGERLNSAVHMPEHYGVANAIGAVSGDVVRRLGLSVTQLAEERYACQLGTWRGEAQDAFALADQAESTMREELKRLFGQSGGVDPEFECERHVQKAEIEPGHEMVLEIRLNMIARGRPAIA